MGKKRETIIHRAWYECALLVDNLDPGTSPQKESPFEQAKALLKTLDRAANWGKKASPSRGERG